MPTRTARPYISGVLETIGYDAATAASFAPWDAADASLGRVSRVDRGVLTVLTEEGPHRVSLGGELLNRIAHDPLAAPCPGDWVVVRAWPDQRRTIEHLLPRRTAVLPDHADPSRGPVLAANVDLVAAVAGPDAVEPGAHLLGRVLALATASGATALAVVLGPPPADGDPGVAELAEQLGTGTDLLHVDVEGGAGLERLRGLVDGRHTLALLGTRATTSLLVRALVGTDVIGVRHPRRGLALLPGGGAVVELRMPP